MKSKDILIKYSEIGLDGLNKVDEKITAELRLVSWEDIESLSKEEFSKMSLPLLYDWAHITGQGAEMQDKITQLANKHKSKKEKVANFFQNSFGELQNLVKENIYNQEKTNKDKN